jgi:subtilisin family serine protease
MKAFDFILAQPTIKVVNASLVFGCDNLGAVQQAFGQAIDTLRARGTLTFASTGNQANKQAIGAPACLASAVAVGAVYDGNVGSISFGCTDAATSADQVTCFSNSSPAVDLLAPGATIASAGLGGGVAGFAGTSQASPHAAGAAALMLQAKPGATADQVEAALKNSGRPLTDPRSGVRAPRIEVKAAVDAIRR